MLILLLLIFILALTAGFLILWRIPKAAATSPPSAATLSLIIPAHNEEHRLPALLESISRQDYQPLEVIVVDDDSTDRTFELARNYGVRVLLTEKLGRGWQGKQRACWTGARMARGERLLFLDADTWFPAEDSLSRLVATYEELGGKGLLSFQPYHVMKRFYETFSVVFNIVLMAGMNAFTPLGSRFTGQGSFGPAMLCNRIEYFGTGGHARVRKQVIDDIAIGRLFQQNELPVHLYGGKSVIHFRMYPEGPASLIEGWSKGFALGSKGTHPLIMAGIVLWIFGGLLLPVVIIWPTPVVTTLIAATLYFLFVFQFQWLARKITNFDKILALIYPVYLLAFLALFAHSLLLTYVKKQVSWRGRKITIEQGAGKRRGD